MFHWAAESTYYHLMIDRFATCANRFDFMSAQDYEQNLQQWMGGNMKAIICSLDYLQDLGIGAILLTPFVQGVKYHGYWVTDFEKVDPHFGTAQQLKQLIHSAHRRNIRVLMDLPITHCHRDSHYAQQGLASKSSPYRDWFLFDDNEKVRGFFGDSNLPELNLDRPNVIAFVKRIASYWLGFGFDGIRFDHAKRPSTAFWQELTDYLSEQHEQIFLLGENWHESGIIGGRSCYLHGELNIPLSQALSEFIKRPESNAIQQIAHHVRAQKSLRQHGYLLHTFLDNHDLERASYLAQNDQSVIALSYLFQLTLPYPPIIYYGSERGQSQSNNLPPDHVERDRFFREPMDWENGAEMRSWVGRLIKYRNKHIAWFMSEPMAMDFLNEKVFSYSYSHNNVLITVVINLSLEEQHILLPSPPVDHVLGNGCVIQQSVNAIGRLRLGGRSGAIVNTERIAVGRVANPPVTAEANHAT
jgi:glycosidase